MYGTSITRVCNSRKCLFYVSVLQAVGSLARNSVAEGVDRTLSDGGIAGRHECKLLRGQRFEMFPIQTPCQLVN